MACGVVLGGDLLFVLLLLACPVHAPAASCVEPGRFRAGNIVGEERSVEKEGQESKDVRGLREEVANPAKNEASFFGQIPRERTGKRFSGVDEHGTHDYSKLALIGRKRRQNPRVLSPDDTVKAHLNEAPWATGDGCPRPPVNPTVVAGIVGGALAFFLVVVLTIIYCSYRNHPPADVRKRISEIYAYMRRLEEVWVGAATPGVDLGSDSVFKYDECEKMSKEQVV